MGMFDDLIPAAATSRKTGGGMFDDLIPGGVPAEPPPVAAGPVATAFGSVGAPAIEPPPGSMPTPGLWDRFKLNAAEGFDNTVAGETINRVQSGQLAGETAAALRRALSEAEAKGSQVGLDSFADGTPNPYGQMPLQMIRDLAVKSDEGVAAKAPVYAANRDARQVQMDAMPSFAKADGIVQKVVQGLVALSGQVAGGLPSPENLIGGAAPVRQAARQAGEKAVPYLARTAAPGAADNAAAAAIANPTVQAGKVERGEQPEFSPTEFTESVILGGGIGGGLKLTGAGWRAMRGWLSNRRGVAPDAVTPDSVGANEIAEALKDPQVRAIVEANGIDPSSADPRILQARDKLDARRGEEALRTSDTSTDFYQTDKKGAKSPEIERRRTELENTDEGTGTFSPEGVINKGATNIQRRAPDERPIRVDSAGGAFREDPGTLAGRDKAAIVERADQKSLPAPGRGVPTDEEITRTRAANEGGQKPYVDAPPTLYGQEGRAPQTSDDVAGQRQAGGAFTLADRQRGRAGEDVRDTQTAGRPQGRGDKPVHLDEGHPVEIVNRRMVPDQNGGMVDVATVRRYDPRTGAPEPDHVEYDVPYRQLKTKQYAPEPRMAQDFEQRARTERINAGRDQGKRMDDAQELPRQTYRQTPPDDNAAGTARADRPERPAGLHPGRRWSTAEEAMRDFATRQQQGGPQDIPPRGSYKEQKTSSKAAAPDKDGRFKTVNDYVASDAGGPVRFADQKQAGKWIINVGQKKSPDQIFEIANHPSGRGFTVRETGRNAGPGQPPPQGGGPAREAAGGKSADTGAPRQLSGPRAEPPPAQPAKPTPRGERSSFDQKVSAERERLWADDMGRASRNKAGNDRMVERSARENVVREEVGDATIREEMSTGVDVDDITDIAQLYRRADGESPQEAWDNAKSKWIDQNEREAVGYENKFTQEDAEFDPLTAEASNPEAAAMADVYSYEAKRAEREEAIDRESLDNIPFDEVPNGKRAADQKTSTPGRDAADGGGAGRAGDGEKTGGGREDAGAYATDAGPDGGRQTVIPGAERDTRGANQRRADQPLKGGNDAPPKGGLFDEDARNQGDIFDAPKPKERGANQIGEAIRSGEDTPYPHDNTYHWDEKTKTLERRASYDDGQIEVDRPYVDGKGAIKWFSGDEDPGYSYLKPAKFKTREAAEKAVADDRARIERINANAKGDFTPGADFHSNPLFDPRVWRWFAKGLGFNEKWRHEMSSLASDLAQARLDRGQKTNKAADFGRMVFYSVDGALRALGKAYDDSPTIKNIADMLFAPADAGRGGAVRQTFVEAVNGRSNKNLNDLAKILEPFHRREDILNQIVRLVQNPHRISAGNPIHDAAAAVRKMLEDEHKYLKAAGVDLGYEKGYFPRELDVSKVVTNPAGFMAAAERAYRASGLGKAEAEKAAESWFQRVALGGVNVRPDGSDFVTLSGSPTRDFAKGRVLSKQADEILSSFYHTNPLEALTVHFQRTARRAEWARRFGDDMAKWKGLKQSMIDEGNAAAIPEVVRMIASSTGANPVILPGAAQSAVGWLRTYGVIRLLPRATITSLGESLLPSIRSGSPGRALGDIARTVRALYKRSGELGELREFTEDLGLIMRGSENGILASRFNALDPANRAQERILNRFFRATGLEQYTAATRVTAVNAAETFIRRLALDVANGNSRKASARSLLTEMGVTDIDGFSKWVSDNAGGKLARDFDSKTAHEETYRSAVTRFVNQSIMAPSASTRPRWANHPLGSLVFMLQSYAYAFHKNVLIRGKDTVVQAASNPDYTAADRARMLAPVAMLPALVAVQLGIAPLRQAVFGTAGKEAKDDDEQTAQYVMQAISRSGLTGAWDAVFNLYSGAKYHRDSATTALGPVVGGAFHAADVMMGTSPKSLGGANSDKTNSAERNAARSVYEMVVAPAAVFGASLLPGPIGAVAAQVPGTNAVRDTFIDSIAGEKREPGSGRRVQRRVSRTSRD